MKVIDFVREFLSQNTYFILHVDNNPFYEEVFYNAKDYTEHTQCSWNYTVDNVDATYSLYYDDCIVINAKVPSCFYALE